jgi:hypothetical protein
LSLRIREPSPAVPPLVIAGVLLAARSLSEPHRVPQPSVAEILRRTGATRSRAYEIKDALEAVLPTLARPPGRPRVEPAPGPGPANMSELFGIAVEMIQFMKQSPGCVQSGARDRYADGYRHFVLELRERHADMATTEFATAVDLPLGTLEDWLRSPAIAEPSITSTTAPCETSATDGIPDPVHTTKHDARQAQIETVLAAWRAWRGHFRGFCAHVRRDHRLELGTTLIANLLFEYGLRVPARRGGRSRDDEALRKSFEIFFPGAQWVGDGKQLAVVIDGKTFHRNLELVVDAASAAAVGISVRDEEDSAAVVQAFTQGVQTTGGTPIALLLDNRPSNHTPEVDAALEDTLRIRATTGRAQNKAHVEGSFGLFAQKVPPIDLDTRDPDALATSVAHLIATTFFRALNRAPRRDRAGKTRAELYEQLVPSERYEAAHKALHDRWRKQELARQTRAARRDPVLAALLDDAFARLGLLDPERHVRDAIACYPRDAIVDAIAIFSGKRTAGTLPDGVDARYLLGIVRNLHHRHEAEPITEALIRERLSARDRFLAPLVAERDAILAANGNEVSAALLALVDRLVRAERTLDRHVWLDAAADLVEPQPPDIRIALAKRAARRIHTSFMLSTRDRAHLERALLRRLWPFT